MHGDNHGPWPEDAAGPRHRLDRFLDAPGRHPATVGASAAGTKSPTDAVGHRHIFRPWMAAHTIAISQL
jgi:hypothetical protein